MKFDVVVTCADGLESLLQQEAGQLNVAPGRPHRGAVTFEVDLSQAYRLCLWSRVASRVLLPLFDVQALTPEALYAAAYDYDWAAMLDPSGTIAVHATAGRGVNIHTQYVALKLKDAIVDHCRAHHGVRPNVETTRPDVALMVHATPFGFEVSLDLSGESLHRRGYRVAMTEAPLKETLAAALLLQAEWPRAFPSPQLMDPMCGSGTLVIEAALMLADIAPGLSRDYFGFSGWAMHDEAVWQSLLDEAKARRDRGLVAAQAFAPLYGFDADPEAVEASQRNARTAGVGGLLRFQQRALHELKRPLQSTADGNGSENTTAENPVGLLVCNPPYGERLGEKPVTRDLYRALGRFATKELVGWRACVLASDVQHVDALGFQHRSTERLHNGALIVYARHADIPPVPARGVTQFVEAVTDLPAEAEAFANRLRKNLKQAQKNAAAQGVYCYRVYDADMPEFNIAIDVYEGQLHVQEYAPPKTVDPEKAEARFRLALLVIRHVFGLRREQVFIKVRARQKGQQQYEKQGSQGRFVEVREDKATLLVNLTDYLDTGLFLDHRPLRLQMAKEAAGKHFLNLFAYTGVASVQAALGGAASTTTVDLSPTYINWAMRNFALNGLPMDAHHFDQADVMQWLRECAYLFDLIFIDPPTFSNSKRTPDVFDVQRDHVVLIQLAMRALRQNGMLYFSNNFRKFKLDTDALSDYLIEDISPSTIGFDFERNPGIHRCWKIQHRDG